jgi:hypothetical protein
MHEQHSPETGLNPLGMKEKRLSSVPKRAGKPRERLPGFSDKNQTNTYRTMN